MKHLKVRDRINVLETEPNIFPSFKLMFNFLLCVGKQTEMKHMLENVEASCVKQFINLTDKLRVNLLITSS